MSSIAGFSPKRAGSLFCLIFLSPVAFAQANIELQGGVSTTTGGERTGVIAASWLPAIKPTRNGVLRLDIGAMRFDGRDTPRRNLADDVGVYYVGIRSEHQSGLLWGIGVGAQSGHTDALSGDPQFVSSLGWRWRHFTLMLRHVSNATLHQPNDGETALLAGLRF